MANEQKALFDLTKSLSNGSTFWSKSPFLLSQYIWMNIIGFFPICNTSILLLVSYMYVLLFLHNSLRRSLEQHTKTFAANFEASCGRQSRVSIVARPLVPVTLTLAFLCVAQVMRTGPSPILGWQTKLYYSKRWCDLMKILGFFFCYFQALTFDQKVKSVCFLFCIFGEIDFYVVNV